MAIKAWLVMTSRIGDARTHDGRLAMQILARVSAHSRKEAARLLGGTDYWLADYGMPQEPITDEDRDLVGVVRVAPLDPGGTIDGTEGWRVADPQPHPYMPRVRRKRHSRHPGDRWST